MIDLVSNGFCRLLGVDRKALIGRELNSVIPDGYKEVHNVRLTYLLDFEEESIAEIVPSRVFHKELKLPIKGVGTELFTGFVCIKFHVDIAKGLSFVSIVKRVLDRTAMALIDFGGRVHEIEGGFQAEVLEHP